MYNLRIVAVFLAGIVAAGAGWSSVLHGAEARDERTARAYSVIVEKGLVSVRCRDASLTEVLGDLADQAEFALTVPADWDRKVSQSFTNVPLGDALGKILGRTSWVATYASDNDDDSDQLAEVYVLRPRTNSSEDLSDPQGVNFGRVGTRGIGKGKNATSAIATSKELLGKGNRDERMRVLRRLIQKPNPKAVAELDFIATHDGDATIRSMAVLALGKIRMAEAKAAVVTALGDEDELVRRRAVQSLGKTWGNLAIEPLQDTLLYDPDPRVRRDAALRLGRIYDEDAYQALDAARFDPNKAVRQAVEAGLIRVGEY